MHFDYDWLVIGSGFGGSVSALRLAQKGYKVGVLECGRRFADDELPKSTWDLRRYWYAPRLGLNGIFRLTIFKDVAIASGSGVGGGSLGYANTLYRAPVALLRGRAVGGAERLAGRARPALRGGGADARRRHLRRGRPRRRLPARVRGGDRRRRRRYAKTRVGVFLGEPGKTVADPFFGGEGPDRTGCLRCGRCMVGCPHGAKNTLVKNYLWFAERAGVKVMPERTVVDIAPLGAPTARRLRGHHRAPSGAAARRDRRRMTAQGVVVAAGALGHQPAARRVPAQRLAAAPLAAARRARAHQQRGDPRRHAPARRARRDPPRGDHRLDLPRPEHPHRDRRLRRRGRRRVAACSRC